MIKKISFVIALILSLNSFAQVNSSSPYSYFGIGDLETQETMASSSMGGIGIASRGTNALNFSNPAGQSALRFTTFSFAGNSKFIQMKDLNNTQNTSNTTLSYIALGFPVTKKGGFLVGLQPNSTVGYSIKDELYNTDGEAIEINTFDGEGGTNRFFGSFGYEVYKGLSLGVEGEYLFGKTENNVTKILEGVTYQTKHRSISKLSGASVKLGVQYQKELTNKLVVNAGTTAKLQNDINAESDEYFYSFFFGTGGVQIPKDTLYSNIDVAGAISRPLQYGVGAGIGKPHNWYAGVDYTTQDALTFSPSIFKNNNKVQYTASSAIKMGGFWLPKVNSLTSYWDRVTYRAGFSYEKTGLSVKPLATATEFTDIDDFGISFGLGLPVGNQMSQINLGFEYGSRGNNNDGLVKENYYNLRLSLNLVDKWFKKNKIN